MDRKWRATFPPNFVLIDMRYSSCLLLKQIVIAEATDRAISNILYCDRPVDTGFHFKKPSFNRISPYSVPLGKIQTRKTRYLDTLHVVYKTHFT